MDDWRLILLMIKLPCDLTGSERVLSHDDLVTHLAFVINVDEGAGDYRAGNDPNIAQFFIT